MIPFVILSIEDEEDLTFMTTLFLSYERLMYAEIRNVISNSWDVEDVFQTTLMKLIEKIPLLRTLEERQLVNYIITAAKNNARSFLRKAAREDSIGLDDDIWVTDDCESTESTVFRAENIRLLLDIWPELDERSKFLLEAKYILGMKSKEIATELNIQPDSVRMELSRARKKARKLMADLEHI